MAQVYLVLTRRDFVVAGLDGDAQLLQHQHRLPPKVGAQVGGSLIEVAAVVDGVGVGGVLKVEVLDLRANVVRESHGRRALYVAL